MSLLTVYPSDNFWSRRLTLLLMAIGSSTAAAQTLSCASAAPASERLTAQRAFLQDGSGFDLGTAATIFGHGACTSAQPFFLSFPATDGIYRITLVLGGPKASSVTVRAESRRLLVNQLHVPAGGTHTEQFLVQVRTPEIASSTTQASAGNGAAAESVRLKPREVGALDWDRKLTLEFNGEAPSVRSVSVVPVQDAPTLYLAGDSTVVDQDKEPYAAWGQMLPAFFGPGLAIANEAESGETIRSFVGERRLAKILSTIRPGDFLMIQFAHNDQKPGKGFVPIADYKAALVNYIQQARAHGATPLIVTSMNRRNFDAENHIVQTLGEYPQAARDVAAQLGVELVDLNAMSQTLFEAMGPQATLHAFVHFPANTFPNQPEALADDTHFTSYGALELAKCVVEALRMAHSPLAKHLRADVPPFDPHTPDPFSNFTLPRSPSVDATKPYER